MSRATRQLYDIAEQRAGYFTAAQAERAGIARQLLRYHLNQGELDRVARGIYRLRQFPSQPFEDVIVACLWAGDDAAASHETALAIYGLTDAMPPFIHISLPRPFRGRRRGVRVHLAPLPASDQTVHDYVPVTTVDRTLRDIAPTAEPDILTSATREALARGLITRKRLQRVAADAPAARSAVSTALGAARSPIPRRVNGGGLR